VLEKLNVLVVDDEHAVCDFIKKIAEEAGCAVSVAHTIQDGLDTLAESPFDAVFLDIFFPEGRSLNIISEFTNAPGKPEVVVMTGYAAGEDVETAIKAGAWNYLAKPLSLTSLREVIESIQQNRRSDGVHVPESISGFDRITGASPAITYCKELMARAANGKSNVLITGETGVGKELCTVTIHDNSKRADGPLVIVDCASLPDTLADEFLLGHEKGAYTGAHQTREGLVKQADGGTLFLDEVGELPLSVQPAFLRVLQERRFRPVGGSREVSSDFRLIAATNRDLDAMVARGQFRQELLFRLRTLTIPIPALRERIEDIPELVKACSQKLSREHGIEEKTLSPEALALFSHYSWPGNIRELFNVVEEALVAAGSVPLIVPKHLPAKLRAEAAHSYLALADKAAAKKPFSMPALPSLKEARRAGAGVAERNYLKEMISICGGDKAKACKIAAVSLPHLYALLKKHNFSFPRPQ